MHILEYLLEGWDVTVLEPTYTPPQKPSPVGMPSYYKLCGSVALGAYLAVAREAARGSTQVSIQNEDIYKYNTLDR